MKRDGIWSLASGFAQITYGGLLIAAIIAYKEGGSYLPLILCAVLSVLFIVGGFAWSWWDERKD